MTTTPQRVHAPEPNAMTSPADAPRIDSLTGLRFIAAGAVLLHHTLAPTILYRGVASIPGTRHLAVVGYVGVTTFFVLSGFVLAWSWDERRTRTGFYGRRFARVWPLHALTWAAVVLVVAPHTGGGIGGKEPTLAQNAAGLALVHGWIPKPAWYFAGNGVSWSLACEAFFYALLPFLVPLLRRSGRRAAIVTISVSTTALVVVPILVRSLGHDRFRLLSLTVFPAYRVGEFLIGVTLGWAVRSGWRPAWSLRQAVVVAVIGYVAAAVLTGRFYYGVGDDRALGNLYSDAIILLRYFEALGEVRQAISILKRRSGAHEKTIREYRIQVGGIKVGTPLHEFQGVLGGIPEYLGTVGPLLGRTSAGDPKPA